MDYIIAYDLGTGGIKASIFSSDGKSVASSFIEYGTYYPHDKWHEQRPMDWWYGVCKSTKALLQKSGVDSKYIRALALSGHSLVAAPMSKDGKLLLDQVPIWSDMRAEEVTADFFSNIPYEEWYLTTGNGDPPECYSVFKLMWLKKHMPDVFEKTAFVLGSKDFINYMLTGEVFTDPSYASGTGVFNLLKWSYSDRFIQASGLPKSIFPPIVSSQTVVGCVTESAAQATGLAPGTLVACGGVDNSCMALGARGVGEGKVYTSLGSSSWIALTSKKPIVDIEKRPFVFAHIEQGYYTSATSIFSAGNSLRWLRDTLCPEDSGYVQINKWAAESPVGSNGVMFNPSLAGGSAQQKSPNIHGGFLGLSLGTTKQNMIRACMEGVALDLKMCLEDLKKYAHCGGEMLICGGGSKSPLWMKIFAAVYGQTVIKTNIDQDAASLGAAAIAARGCGMWNSYDVIESLHKIESIYTPEPQDVIIYNELYNVFLQWSSFLAKAGDDMNNLHIKGVW